MELEICCGDIESVLAAKKGGAKRIELCSSLSEGGVTPSYALIEEASKTGFDKINVLIRPRGGDFLYSPKEIKIMSEDIRQAVKAGATGIVIGALTSDGEIDKKSMEILIDSVKQGSKEVGRDVSITFHRAFDMSRDPLKSLEDIISLGCDTLLTSGMSSTALSGTKVIKELVEQAGDRITILVGSGINPSNVLEIIEKTGVRAIHATAKEKKKSGMIFRRESLTMGSSDSDEYMTVETSEEIVRNLLNLINK